MTYIKSLIHYEFEMIFIEKEKTKIYLWLCFSVIVAILFALSALKIAFQSSYTIQDDARQYIFWMQQFQEKTLFQNDLIADYFQSVTPIGFIYLYKFISSLGINIFIFNKISTLILGIITTIYLFLVCLEIFPIPFAGFMSSLLLNQNLWMVDDLSSGTPRAYIYFLLLAFIYYLLRKKLGLCLLTIILQGLFYPQAILISIAVLGLRLLQKKNSSRLEFWGLLIGIIILSIYAFKTSDFTPVITAREAKLLPEFLPGGRSAFFSDNFSQFWLTDRRSGFFPIEWQYSLMCVYGIGVFWLRQYPKKFPLIKNLTPQIKIIRELFLASILLFFLAHLFLFRLHLPGRYTHHTIRIIIALLDGMAITVLFHNFNLWTKNKKRIIYYLKNICLIIILCGLLYPTYAVQNYPERFGYVRGESENLYDFLQQQPSSTLIATLSEEADFIPSLAARPILVAREYAIPYHQGYYKQFRQRVTDLITAQYTLNPKIIVNFIEKYNVDLLLIDNNAFTVEYLSNNQWLQQFLPQIDRGIKVLKNKERTIIDKISDRCNLLTTKKLTLLDSKCILKILK